MSSSDRKQSGLEEKVEALTREVERLRVLASRDRGLVEAILEHSPHGIIISDVNGKLTLQNKAAETIWAGSATAENVEGWGQYRAFHSDGRPFEPGDWSMAKALSEGVVTVAEERHFQRFDGTHGTLIGSSAPIYAADGAIEGALSVFVDISRFKDQEDELRLGAERYFTTLKSIGDAVIATDARGAVTFLNPVAETLTQWSLAEARGKPLNEVFRIIHEHTRAVAENPADKVIREGKVVVLANHTLLVARDGSEIPIDDSGAPIFNARQELVGVVLVFRDVTEKRREEDRRSFMLKASALLASSLDYQATLASVAKLSVPSIADWCAVDMLVAPGSLERLAVEHVDPAKVRFAAEIEARYPSDPTSPHSIHEVVRSGVAQTFSDIPDALLVAAAVDDEHLRLMRALGLRSSMVVPLRCRGVTLGVITFVSAESNRRFGPTDLALAEELASVAALAVENARLYREAQDANRSKDDFLATVSHELRTPLNAMLGWTHLLRTADMPDEKRVRALETIERNARAQARLIDDLLDVSRIVSGKLRLELAPIDLATIIAGAVDAVRPQAEAKGLILRAVLEDEAARHAMGDAARLQQVIGNLLSNAIKFTERGGSIDVGLRAAEQHAEVEVTDSGHGIDAEFLPLIFDRFEQANATRARAHGGLGLGLAIVKHLVELHGGTVSASSPGPKQGASFRLRVPLAAQSSAARSAAAASAPVPELDGLHILVVDDEEDARALVAELLRMHGALVDTAASAAEALRSIELSAPAVLLSDIGMPGEDGYSFIGKVRALPNGGPTSLPAAALTAFARAEDRERALAAGFQSHVTKPLDPSELFSVVRALVKSKKKA
jgi:PAS domain S-box-containing protein